ncbi:alpha/beta hydrolase [Acinetobacter sp. A3.8]|uniref:Alpha/beta hydrolase n=1 Tax=Acinetobacter sedimenti TaxID=2919922 RepID=A0A9X1WZZ8_9GAMM|nr:alpha/beta hydrolase [Acinetobacter sedimenti]MCJ8146570.1 alpha/beta hydrolase [Acinetobacter sedimenti]
MFQQSLLVVLSISMLGLTGCQVVSVKEQKVGTTLSNERDSILTRDELSEASLNVLSMSGQETKKCINDPNQCMQDLAQIPQIVDEQYLSAGSEIFLAHAIRLNESSSCDFAKTHAKEGQNNLDEKQKEKYQQLGQQYIECTTKQLESLNNAIRYSYAYLFATKRPATQRLFDNRQVQVRDFYNQAIANLVNKFNQQDIQKQSYSTGKMDIGESVYHVNLDQYPSLAIKDVDQLVSTYNIGFSGLRSISRRDGFGSEFAVQLKKSEKKPLQEFHIDPFLNLKNIYDHPNIHEAQIIPATIVVAPKDRGSVKAILNSKDLIVNTVDPNKYKDIKVNDQIYPLAANFSAPYGLWLANNNLGVAGYLSLIDREQDLIMPHLFMLEPYNPKKKVIVMIHGLASSPETWIALTNDIMGDNVLREHYQVWQVFYSTNMPIMESRYQIYALLKQAFDGVNQHHPTHTATNAVLLGHSMGGVIGRLLVSDADYSTKVMEHLKQNDFRNYNKIKNLAAAQPRFRMNALTPPIDRAIFLASPFRGTDFADRWFTLAARKIIRLPQNFLKATLTAAKAGLGDEEAQQMLERISKDFLQNGPSDLSKKSAFSKITGETKINSGVKYHLIMGNYTDSTDKDVITDGIVPYHSAHIDGAVSEKIIKGGHSIHLKPEAVLEVRRILRLHLQELGLYKP